MRGTIEEALRLMARELLALDDSRRKSFESPPCDGDPNTCYTHYVALTGLGIADELKVEKSKTKAVDPAEARLIAAAPDLLSALVEISGIVANTPSVDAQKVERIALSAITKAEGKGGTA